MLFICQKSLGSLCLLVSSSCPLAQAAFLPRPFFPDLFPFLLCARHWQQSTADSLLKEKAQIQNCADWAAANTSQQRCRQKTAVSKMECFTLYSQQKVMTRNECIPTEGPRDSPGHPSLRPAFTLKTLPSKRHEALPDYMDTVLIFHLRWIFRVKSYIQKRITEILTRCWPDEVSGR